MGPKVTMATATVGEFMVQFIYCRINISRAKAYYRESKDIILFTGSLGSLQLLKYVCTSNPIKIKISKLQFTLNYTNHSVVFTWIQEHNNIKDNCKTEEAEKAESLTQPSDRIDSLRTDLYQFIISNIMSIMPN